MAPDAHAPELATVAATLNFAALDAGDGHTCAVTVSTGKAYCWGHNDRGQLGDGTTTTRLTPTAVAGGHFFATVSASAFKHSCSVTSGRLTGFRAYCWGRNDDGQLGDGTTTGRLTPTQVASP